MAKKNLLGKKRPTNEQMALQITSMADIFTIILVFLLKTFSTGVSSITPSGNLVLPAAKAEVEQVEVLKLEVGPDSILLDDKPVSALKDFQPDPRDLERDGTLRSLNVAIGKIKARKGTAANEGSSEGAHLMILADRYAPYGLIKSVVAAAANGGFQEFKLAVVKEE